MFPINFGTWLAQQPAIVSHFGSQVYWGEVPATVPDKNAPILIWSVDDGSNSTQPLERKSYGANYVVSFVVSVNSNRGNAWRSQQVVYSLLRANTSLTLPGTPDIHCQTVKYIGRADSLDDQMLDRGFYMVIVKFSFYIGSEEE